jgi:uncharacterized protein (DUF302 family)
MSRWVPTRLILFGNPKAGTPIMQANPRAGLELPLRLLVWKSDTGKVSVDFSDPVDVCARGTDLMRNFLNR